MKNDKNITGKARRNFLKQSVTTAAGITFFPYLNFGKVDAGALMTRDFGRCDFDVTSFGLGGQASLQWTPEDVDPVRIILKAFDRKVNYYDTSNLYGPSQVNFAKAFKTLNLVPGVSGYNEKLRKSIFLTSKTHLRWARGNPSREGVTNRSNGDVGGGTVSDLKRSLSQIFGDGKGRYPKGAYLDMMLIHNLNTMEEVDALYTGLDNTDPGDEYIGALAALRDYRDGTNLTGLNPGQEKLIRHIGFSGHYSAPVMMEMIQRDDGDILDAMLVAINANDLLNFNMQYNVIPVARAKNMGIIAMKVFADGAMYTKEATWSNVPEHVVRTVGSRELPSRPLVEYALTTPGVSTAIIGIGEISANSSDCQLTQNLSSAQIREAGLSGQERKEIEGLARHIKNGNTNYFQVTDGGMTAARNIRMDQTVTNGKRVVRIQWDTAYAGDEPINNYMIYRDNQRIAKVAHRPQTGQRSFLYEDMVKDTASHDYRIETVDASDRKASGEKMKLESTG